MSFYRTVAALSTLVCAAQLAVPAHATTVTQLTSASQLSPNDTAFVDKDAAGTVYAASSVAFINGGSNKLIFSRGSGQFETDVAGVNYGNTAFANNTVLVGAGGFQGSGDGGAITLKFAVPIVQFGMNIEDFEDAGTGSDNYAISFFAYDASGNLIGNTNAFGVFTPAIYSSTGCSDNSCLSFEGMTVSGDAISSIIFNDSGAGGGSNDLMFGNIAYAPLGTALQAPNPTVTPEPSSIALLGTGLLSLAGIVRRAAAFRGNTTVR